MKNTFILAILSIFLSVNSQEDDYIVYILKGHSDNVNTAAFSIDDKFVYTGSDDKMIKQWDMETGEMVREVEAHYKPVKKVLCLNDGVTIFSAGEKVVKSWNTLLEYQEGLWSHTTYVWSFDVNPERNKMICGTFDKKIYLWDLITNEATRLEAHEKTALAVAYSHDGKYFASGSLDLHVFIWNAANLEVEKVGIGHADNIYDLEFTSDGKYLISVSKDKMIKIWEVETGGHYRTLSGHTDAVMSVSIHQNSRFFITASYDGTIRLWDLVTGNSIYTFIKHDGPVNEVCFSHNGKYFVSSSNDKTAIIWNFSPGLIANFQYAEELENEWEQNAVFSPKRKNESRTDYLERQERANEKRNEIYLKYYNKYLKEIN